MIPLHPLATKFDALKGDAFEQFALDIERNGIREKCITYQGQLVDGQNRQLAVEWCEKRRLARIERTAEEVRSAQRALKAAKDAEAEANARAAGQIAEQAHKEALAVKPYVLPTVEWDGKGSLISLVASKNIARRHLSPSQVAAWWIRVTAWEDAERDALARKNDNLKRGKARPIGTVGKGRTREDLAKQSGVSEQTIARAQRVAKKGIPELAAAVERGDLSAHKAAGFAKLSPAEQRKALDKEKAKAERDVQVFDARESFARWQGRLETQLRQYEGFDTPLPELVRACKRLIALHAPTLKRVLRKR